MVRIENPKINSHKYSHLIFDRKSGIHNGEKTLSSINVAGKVGYPYTKEWFWIFISYHLQWATLNVLKSNLKAVTIKLLDKNKKKKF